MEFAILFLIFLNFPEKEGNDQFGKQKKKRKACGKV